jgi:radical SAM/Cys-rich protein
MTQTLAHRHHPLSILGDQREIIAHPDSLPQFHQKLAGAGVSTLRRKPLRIMQISVGKMCNQVCKHCHVDAGPDRSEIMTRETMQQCLDALATTDVETVDITGGAPEMNPDFKWLVECVRQMGRHVIDRCNLTILTVRPYADMVEFLAQHHVEIIASLPYFQRHQTDAQRGEGVFEKSIEGLRLLNAAGYGKPGSGLELNLVYNPVGAFLPPAQESIQADFRRELLRRFEIQFNHLYTITNTPINRFLEYLLDSGNYVDYMRRLHDAFNPTAARGVMCRETLSVGWDGRLFDCDFNQQIELGVGPNLPPHIRDFDPAAFDHAEIVIGNHCYGCTAGAGSSCGGTTA